MLNIFVSEYIKKIRENDKLKSILKMFNKHELTILLLAILVMIIYLVLSLTKCNKYLISTFGLLSYILSIIFDIKVYYDCKDISKEERRKKYSETNIKPLKDLLCSFKIYEQKNIDDLIDFCNLKLNEKPSFLIYNPVILSFATLMTTVLSIFSNCFSDIAAELNVSVIDLFVITIIFFMFICGILLILSGIVGKYINRKPYLIQLRDDLFYLKLKLSEK